MASFGIALDREHIQVIIPFNSMSVGDTTFYTSTTPISVGFRVINNDNNGRLSIAIKSPGFTDQVISLSLTTPGGSIGVAAGSILPIGTVFAIRANQSGNSNTEFRMFITHTIPQQGITQTINF